MQFCLRIFLLFYFSFCCWLWFFHPHRITKSNKERIVNLIPFKTTLRTLEKAINASEYKLEYFESFAMNFFGNIFLFIPFGFFLPLCIRRFEKIRELIFVVFFLSFVAESMQFILRIGIFDVDDLILNFIGGLIGWAIWMNLSGVISVKLKKTYF